MLSFFSTLLLTHASDGQVPDRISSDAVTDPLFNCIANVNFVVNLAHGCVPGYTSFTADQLFVQTLSTYNGLMFTEHRPRLDDFGPIGSSYLQRCLHQTLIKFEDAAECLLSHDALSPRETTDLVGIEERTQTIMRHYHGGNALSGTAKTAHSALKATHRLAHLILAKFDLMGQLAELSEGCMQHTPDGWEDTEGSSTTTAPADVSEIDSDEAVAHVATQVLNARPIIPAQTPVAGLDDDDVSVDTPPAVPTTTRTQTLSAVPAAAPRPVTVVTAAQAVSQGKNADGSAVAPAAEEQH